MTYLCRSAVKPKSIDQSIKHIQLFTHLYLLIPFRTQGSGISQAKVSLNGKDTALSASNGQYQLENMKTGQYKLQVTADNLKFEEMNVKITPNTPQLPDIVASRFVH